jgi:uncharacterized protein YndB with AHSA1/START domain
MRTPKTPAYVGKTVTWNKHSLWFVSDRGVCKQGHKYLRDQSNNVNKGFVAKASISVRAPVSKVWEALVDPEIIKQYMFGTNVVSEWKEGAPIVWKGVWKGTGYEDKGVIIKLVPEHVVQYSHFSPLSGLADSPENYHTVTIKLTAKSNRTLLSLSQDNNPTKDARDHSEKNWEMMLAGIKKFLEGRNTPRKTPLRVKPNRALGRLQVLVGDWDMELSGASFLFLFPPVKKKDGGPAGHLAGSAGSSPSPSQGCGWRSN